MKKVLYELKKNLFSNGKLFNTLLKGKEGVNKNFSNLWIYHVLKKVKVPFLRDKSNLPRLQQQLPCWVISVLIM